MKKLVTIIISIALFLGNTTHTGFFRKNAKQFSTFAALPTFNSVRRAFSSFIQSPRVQNVIKNKKVYIEKGKNTAKKVSKVKNRAEAAYFGGWALFQYIGPFFPIAFAYKKVDLKKLKPAHEKGFNNAKQVAQKALNYKFRPLTYLVKISKAVTSSQTAQCWDTGTPIL